MGTSREGEVSSVDRVTMDKNKRKLGKVLKYNKEDTMNNREKWIVSHPFLLSKAKTVKAVYQAMLVKKILTLACLKLKKTQI